MARRRKKNISLLLVSILILAVIGCYLLHYKGIIHIPFFDTVISTLNGDSSGSDSSQDDSSNSSQGPSYITADGVSIHFLELGNKYTGDCTYIKAGDTDILIDAGSRKDSAPTITSYVNQYCTDGVLEYVIATHADADHIYAFVGEDGVFANFECETIIDYPLTNSNTAIRRDYEALRDAEVQAGASHYTALECWNNANGAQRSYQLGDDITLNILYQKYYVEKTSTENNYSVCTLISYGEKHFLFTGDLESSGEKSLLESNDLPVCELFKSGHHGSNTSNTPELISKIRPKTVILTCCCGDKFDFPHQETIDTIAPYTDKVYAPTMSNGDSWTLLNGDIKVSFNGKNLTVNCSNNNLLFKDTAWFKANRTMPAAWKQTA